jgi:hypothetical protein
MAMVFVSTSGHLSGQTLWIKASGGYLRESFRWSIAGNSAGRDPNVYSELKWQGTAGPAAGVEFRWHAGQRWTVFGQGSRAFVTTGKMTDTDYGLDNRYDPIYSQQFAVHAGHSGSAAAAVGYALVNRGRFRLTPYLGWGFEQQYFPVSDPGAPYEGLHSSYAARWLGPLAKAEASWLLSGRWQVVADIYYHQVSYHATADWNLIADFSHPVSFRQYAEGYGLDAEAGLRFTAAKRVAICLRGGYFDWETGTGIDQLFLNMGGSDQTQLNGVVRDGWKGAVTIEWAVF